jgi:hypothetical protein
VVKVLPKVWVQFDGLPKELCDFLIIWAVGSILGITKDVDMVFTRKYEVCRLQVLVLDPNLIPQFVDVVIGESLYSLWFKVETNGDGEEPVLMEMDNFEGDDDQQVIIWMKLMTQQVIPLHPKTKATKRQQELGVGHHCHWAKGKESMCLPHRTSY